MEASDRSTGPVSIHNAWWVRHPGAWERAAGSMAVVRFRRVFDVPDPTARLTISVSSQTRHKLWVNGQPAVFGPSKGDRWRHYYDTADVSHLLLPGANTIAVTVISYPAPGSYPFALGGPMSVHGTGGAPQLILAGAVTSPDGDLIEDLSTGPAEPGGNAWFSTVDETFSWSAYPPTHFIAPAEHVHGAVDEGAWRTAVDAGDVWLEAEVGDSAAGLWGDYGVIPSAPLLSRPVPLMFERGRSFLRSMPAGRDDSSWAHESALVGEPLNLAPGERVVTILDAGELTTGFVSVRIDGGSGASIRIRYAEAYSRDEEGRSFPAKGRRDDYLNFDLIGIEDSFTAGGGQQSYEPFWWRAFRFVRVEIHAADEPVVVQPLVYRETGYPLQASSSVDGSPEWLQPVWDVSVRTLQRCLHETFEDCPYYEQLQYVLDSRLQALYMYRLGADPRMARRAIEDFAVSRLPDGMIQARYPCVESQVIPAFGLYWVLMVAEYVEQTGDEVALRHWLPTVHGILDWYQGFIGPMGLVEGLPYWEFFDWVPAWERGVPNACRTGPSSAHNALFVAALRRAARLSTIADGPAGHDQLTARADEVSRALMETCFDGESGLLRDGPLLQEFSEHAQVWAVLGDVITGVEAQQLIDRMVAAPDLHRCTVATSYDLFRALEKVGRYELTEPRWQVWRDMLAEGLTTWAEDPEMKRSDCHAWGSLALFEFPHAFLGVRPDGDAWSSIAVEPLAMFLGSASGSAATPHGIVNVSWSVEEEGRFRIDGESPSGIPLVVRHRGAEMRWARGGPFSWESPTA